jgi:thioredoxin-related protein
MKSAPLPTAATTWGGHERGRNRRPPFRFTVWIAVSGYGTEAMRNRIAHMKRRLIAVGLAATLCQTGFALEWLTDVPTAVARAKKENKAVLLDFTGSDWCGWCMKLKSEVFDRFEFAGYAASNLILVEVDFPKRKSIGAGQLNANYALAEKYGVKGYPTIIVVDADGVVLGKCGYMEGGPSAFVARLEQFPGMPHKGGYMVAAPTPAPAVSAGNGPAIAVKPSAPAAAPEPQVAPPPLYGELTLKGVSGAGNRRLALINNQALMTGESAFVRSFTTNIEVTVKEIRDASVLIVVKGQTRELSMGGAPAR